MKKDLRNIILEKAAIVFNQYGYKKTTINDIAKAIGKGKSSVYYYFNSKEEIFISVVENEVDHLRKELITTVNNYHQPVDKLRGYILARMKVYEKASSLYKAFTLGMHSQIAYVDEIRRKHDTLEINLLSDIIEEGCVLRQFVVNEPRYAAIAIVQAMKGIEQPLFNDNSEQEIESITNQLLEVLLMGIVRR